MAVRIVFVIDACDREIIAWSAAANAGISCEMVCDLMIAAVERRFQTLNLAARDRREDHCR
jgi:putative transposase